jgi:hypothetical protein
MAPFSGIPGAFARRGDCVFIFTKRALAKNTASC